MEINNTSTAIMKPVEINLKVNKLQNQQGIKELSTPIDLEQPEEFKVELSQLSKKIQTIAQFDKDKATRLTDILKNANETNTKEMYNYGKSEEELIKENGEDLEVPKSENKAQEVEVSAANASEKMEKLQEKTGELVKKHPSMPGGEKQLEEHLSETAKINKEMGNTISKDGIETEEENIEETKTQEASNIIKDMQEKTGELVKKHPKMPGADNKPPVQKEEEMAPIKAENLEIKKEENLSPAEIINQKMDELKNKTEQLNQTLEALSGKEPKGNKAVSTLPRSSQNESAAAKAQQDLAEMQNQKGELVENHPDLPGERNLVERPSIEDENNELRLEIEKTIKNLTPDEIETFLPYTVNNVNNVIDFAKKIDSLPVEERNSFLNATEKLEGDELENFISSTAKLEGNSLKSYVNTASDLADTGGPNVNKFIKTVSNMEQETHLGETDLERFIESVRKRSGVEKTLFLLGRYTQAFY